MPKQTKTYEEHLQEDLKDPVEVAEYLNAAVEDGDLSVLLLALRDVAEAQGVSKVAARANLNREHAYRILSQKGNPKFTSLCALLRGLGVEFQFAPIKKAVSAATSAVVAPKLDTTQGTTNDQCPAVSRKGQNDGSPIPPNDESLAA